MNQTNDGSERHFSPSFNRLLLFVLILPSITQAIDTSATARTILNKMSQATHALNYDGIFVYRRGGDMDAMRIIHKSNDGKEYARLVSLNGIAREVIRDSDSVTCIFPDDKAVTVQKSQPPKFLPANLPEPIEAIAEFYTFSLAGTDRIAGRPTWIISIDPKDQYRYGYRLWIDRDTNLLLKSELLASNGDALEQILFTQITLPEDIPESLLEPAISGAGYKWYTHGAEVVPARAGNGRWTVTWLPNGFAMSDHALQPMPVSQVPVDHMVFSDGLAIISVFVEEPEEARDTLEGHSQMGALNAFGTLVQGHQVTAVGEVPELTVQKVATSVVQRN
ncbi:MAG: MucB/RseB C-terminal domain-containing protein [Gammaproteobacteria bacterium]|nr:MucB/RseB C-terminal domain-containing protein [Gammaproteobacteria bacterium]MCI0590951.1 MucB/RseB C-terminal domain-containing protein [Gammaproteobacteria bacterium]